MVIFCYQEVSRLSGRGETPAALLPHLHNRSWEVVIICDPWERSTAEGVASNFVCAV